MHVIIIIIVPEASCNTTAMQLVWGMVVPAQF